MPHLLDAPLIYRIAAFLGWTDPLNRWLSANGLPPVARGRFTKP